MMACIVAQVTVYNRAQFQGGTGANEREGACWETLIFSFSLLIKQQDSAEFTVKYITEQK